VILSSITVYYDGGEFRVDHGSERGLSAGTSHPEDAGLGNAVAPVTTPGSSDLQFAASMSSTSTSSLSDRKRLTENSSAAKHSHSSLEKAGTPHEESDGATSLGKTPIFPTSVPYYLQGKTRYKDKKFHHKKTFQRIDREEAKPIGGGNGNGSGSRDGTTTMTTVDASHSETVWVLRDNVRVPTRNHESILLEYTGTNGDDKQILVNVLGRYSREVQWMDLLTGEQHSIETTGTDPDRRPLNDLNHVASVVVDSLAVKMEEGSSIPSHLQQQSTESQQKQQQYRRRERKEVWLPCGFHNDRIGNELSSNYVRIVDLEKMAVRTGPKLPYSGGACGAAPIEAIQGEPPLVCAFGGTDGNHDTGVFLPYVSCYDRVTEHWVYPFGKLPVGMDHLSVAVIPQATCHPDDPARVLVFNFRTKNYSTHKEAEILAFDLPENGWTRDELTEMSADREGAWYTFANHSFVGGADEAYAPRDASGVVMANGGRSLVNFGGINQIPNPRWKKGDRRHGPKVFSTWYSVARELKVCSKTWQVVADMGIQTFALMASASTKLNAAFFCGGAMYRQDYKGNTRLCLAFRIPGIDFWNHRIAAVENFPPGFEAGGEASGVEENVYGNEK